MREAKKALEFDPGLAEAHAAQAAVNYRDWDWKNGHEESQRAIEISPGVLDGCFCYAMTLATTGRIAYALEIADQTLSRNPLAGGAYLAKGFSLYIGRRFTDAIPVLQRGIELDPSYKPSYNVLAMVYEQLGRTQEAIDLLERSGSPDPLRVALAYAVAGRRAEALRIVQRLTAPDRRPERRGVAFVYLALADKDRGLEWYGKSLDAREVRAAWVLDPALDSVRGDTRFQAMVARLMLPPEFDDTLNSLHLSSAAAATPSR